MFLRKIGFRLPGISGGKVEQLLRRALPLDRLHPLTEPISSIFGLDRGSAIDRYYIEKFIQDNRASVTGTVLEVGDDSYTRRYGTDVIKSDVLHVSATEHSAATIIDDLTTGLKLNSNYYDCIICTQTLHCIYDFHSAISTLHRIVKPGGTLLVTVPGITPGSRYDMGRWGEFWRFTSIALEKALAKQFGENGVKLQACGNVFTCAAFLYGFAMEELEEKLFTAHDPAFEMIVCAAAVKS